MLIVENFKIQNYSDNMTDEELYEFCVMNKELRIERDQDQNIIIMASTGGGSGFYEGEFIADVKFWVRKTKKGIGFSSSVGFILPNGAMRSPDASWVSTKNWETVKDKKKFLPIVPEFVVEVRSPSDNLKPLKAKMQEWLDNGVLLGWLIDIQNKQTLIYRKDQAVEVINGFDKKLSGEAIMPEFEFDLAVLKMP